MTDFRESFEAPSEKPLIEAKGCFLQQGCGSKLVPFWNWIDFVFLVLFWVEKALYT